MSERRNAILGLAVIVVFITSGMMANAQTRTPEKVPADIDYRGFAQVSEKVMTYRESRKVSLAGFNEMRTQPDTIILDTRSRAAYEAGHIRGAVHLNFSDITDEALADLIPTRDTRILIYCNNNFTDDARPVMLKRSPFALNIPTFITLYGYGYENIYELGEQVSIHDADVYWTGLRQAS
ncbi:rhodanese-like domain-containing protein [Henriciella sp.]|uniref:rhodanese-like domain-containing protein n=1 Tax=Henriciella sp. TaxID=1968823 RepID=UPI00262B8B31|nr:rhodanese-like domain-containing protein [Henriciella sp.]